MEYVKLNNGIRMPILGFGTYYSDNLNVYESVSCALKTGYRQFDTAKWYNNEREVARAIKDSNINRNKLFITCKIECKGFEEAIKDVNDTLNIFNTSYLDLILIHWPTDNVIETYKALEYLYEKKIAKAIGVSNFNQELCDYILNMAKIKPQINQIETHIYFQEKKMHKFLEENNIYHEAWSQFGEGLINVFNDEVINKLSKQYNKSAAQIMLRFFIQKNIIVIPRSSSEEHIKENFNVFDFAIDEEDINEIEKLDKKMQLSGWPTCMSIETKY